MKKFLNRLDDFLHQLHLYLKESYVMLVFFIIYISWFFIIEHLDRTHFHVIHVALDDMIPFCEIFIIPYMLWFFYAGLTVVYLYARDRQNYHRTSTMLIMGMLLFLIISSVFPTVQDLRPAVMPRTNIFTGIISALYKCDTPTNVTPSIHVYNSVCIMIAVRHSEDPFLRQRNVIRFYDILGVLIILSTMFIKQHSFFDVISGLFLSLAAYILVYRYNILFSGAPGTRTEIRIINNY